MQRTLIWDLPTRLFHWTLVSSFALAWLTSEGDRWRSIHVFLGYLVLGVVGFRVVWGFVGSHFSRFANFWFSPREAFVYLKQVLTGHAPRHVGHNPTGSLAIYILLALALVICVTGIVTLGGDERQGIAAGWLTFSQAQPIRKLHELAAIAMLLVVCGHLAGVVVESALHKENLARSMITGFKLAAPGTPKSTLHRTLAGVMLLTIFVFGGWWFFYAIDRNFDERTGRLEKEMDAGIEQHVKFVGKQLPDNELWRDECGKCHSEFYPALLPGRSWEKILAQKDDHHGKKLKLDAPTAATVLKFLTENSADMKLTEAAFKIERSIPKDSTPLRITETPFWIQKHQAINAADWANPAVKNRYNCIACHEDAKAGTFEDAAMHIPAAPIKATPTERAAPADASKP